MAKNFRVADAPNDPPDGAGVRIGVLCARFNELITSRMLHGVLDGLARHGVDANDVRVEWVPGAFELPLAAKRLAQTGSVDAVVALGAVIRGDTGHYDFVAGGAATGLQQAQLDTGVPVIFGVLTTENLEQALVRSVPEAEAGDYASENKGYEAAVTALEMVAFLRRL